MSKPSVLTVLGVRVRIGFVSLELISCRESRNGSSVTLQVAVGGVLAHPFSLGKDDFLNFPEGKVRDEFLQRSARTLIDVYGDARDGRRLSDSEVQERTAH